MDRGLDQASPDELALAGVADLDPAMLTPAGSVAAKRSLGSTAPAEVTLALASAKHLLQSLGDPIA